MKRIKLETKSNVFIVYRWHDSISRKYQSQHQKKKKCKDILEVLNSFSQISVNQIYIQIFVVFIHGQQAIKKEIRKTILLIIATKRIKCLGVNIIKEGKDLYSKNCMILGVPIVAQQKGIQLGTIRLQV